MLGEIEAKSLDARGRDLGDGPFDGSYYGFHQSRQPQSF